MATATTHASNYDLMGTATTHASNYVVGSMFIFQDSNGSSELQEIMRRRQEKISAAASDSGVESFDEGSSHWSLDAVILGFVGHALF